MFIARMRSGRTPLATFEQDLKDLEGKMGSESMQVQAELGRQLERSRRSLGVTLEAVMRALPTRCAYCGGRVVRTDPMATKSCNGCGRWAE
jgi:hypothetical protein